MNKIAAYTFDDFVLDVDLQNVTYREYPVRITSKATQILFVLVRDHGRVVDKEHFLKEVWPDTFIEEATLAQNILTLRKAFEKFNKGKEFIVTVQRRGYLFVEKVEEVLASENVTIFPKEKDTHGQATPQTGMFHLFLDIESGFNLVRRVRSRCDEPVIPAGRSTRSLKMSPDGKRLACALWDPTTDRMMLALISAETGEVINFPITPRNDDIPFLYWSGDGNDLYAVLRRAKPVSLWRISINGGQPVQLLEWGNEMNLRLSICGEGTQIFYEVEAN